MCVSGALQKHNLIANLKKKGIIYFMCKKETILCTIHVSHVGCAIIHISVGATEKCILASKHS